MKFIGIAILVLAASVLIAALPDLREMDRQNKYMRECMAEIVKKDKDRWYEVGICNKMWHGESL